LERGVVFDFHSAHIFSFDVGGDGRKAESDSEMKITIDIMSSLNKLWERNDPLVCQLKDAVKKDDPYLIPDGISAKRMIRPFRTQESELCETSYNVLESTPVPTRILDWVFDHCADRLYLYFICVEQFGYRQVRYINNYTGSLHFARGAGYLLCKLLDENRPLDTPTSSAAMATWSAAERASAERDAARRAASWDDFWKRSWAAIEERCYAAARDVARSALTDLERRLEEEAKDPVKVAANKRVARLQEGKCANITM
jgi:hypothetical protein